MLSLVRRRQAIALRVFVGAVSALVVAAGCAAPGGGDADPPARQWTATVVADYPHDSDAYTQGLEIHDGRLYESTGLYGKSRIAIIDMTTGEITRRVALPTKWFGEGLTVTRAGIWQLTWRNEIAALRDPTTLRVRRTARYDGEGWGICHQASADRLVMSDGSDTLTFRNPRTFAAQGSVSVTRDGRPQQRLNELECIDGYAWANVFERGYIVRIELNTGRITDVVYVPKRHSGGVLNGIAALPGTTDLLVTGKNWPSMYRITPRGRER